MRNINAHDYENLNMEYAWNTLIEDIPQLKGNLTEILIKEKKERISSCKSCREL
ncbi:MAG: DUF86 domain-containing protein [Selenomonadaceae bacterium]|nr:DUF86 domain-containing protein [Selenomonadaceae bacterium]